MARTIQQIAFPTPMQPRLKRVGAYARVSSGKDAMLHSLAAQVDHYKSYIQRHPGWAYVEVYADEAITGTKDTRENFQRMLRDCRAGKIDHILTKSVSRFARNTVTLLETVRELKGLGVSVYFEEQSIDTATADGELMLTILASYAQEESLSVSENQKWRVKRNFENGMPWNGTILGYRYQDGTYIIVPEEAEIVRFIFDQYLSGKGITAIMKILNERGIPTRLGNAWGKNSVMQVLRNYAYTGNLLLQKTYRENHLTKRTRKNNGELPKYHVVDSHEAIIPREQFNAVQEEIQRRAEKHTHPGVSPKTYPFTGMVVCAGCGRHYRRKVTRGGPVWICSTFNTLGKRYCPSKAIPERTLLEIAAQVAPLDKITAITARNGNLLEFTMEDGTTTVKQWQDRSRAESWTEEMRKAAGERRRRQNANC